LVYLNGLRLLLRLRAIHFRQFFPTLIQAILAADNKRFMRFLHQKPASCQERVDLKPLKEPITWMKAHDPAHRNGNQAQANQDQG
jgi:hypothetical protein